MDAPPLILTCLLNPEATGYFNGLRREHFPPERNYLDAHLTLFHHLPPDEPDIEETLRGHCSRLAPFELQVTEVVFIGKGVAYKITSHILKELHQALQQRWKHWLIPQDAQGLWPHITVQNKVEPWKARHLKETLEKDFKPFAAKATGLALWEYQGGPWQLHKTFLFEGQP